MGIGDRSDPTTDFFDTHRAQCAGKAAKLRAAGVSEGDATLVALDEAVAQCDAAIAGGRKRTDQAAVVAKMPAIVTKYAALSPATKTAVSDAEKAEAPPSPKGTKESVK